MKLLVASLASLAVLAPPIPKPPVVVEIGELMVKGGRTVSVEVEGEGDERMVNLFICPEGGGCRSATMNESHARYLYSLLGRAVSAIARPAEPKVWSSKVAKPAEWSRQADLASGGMGLVEVMASGGDQAITVTVFDDFVETTSSVTVTREEARVLASALVAAAERVTRPAEPVRLGELLRGTRPAGSPR